MYGFVVKTSIKVWARNQMNFFLLKQKNLHDSSSFTPGGKMYSHMSHLGFTLRILWRVTLPAGFEDCFLF